eukprot:3590680-Pyramimonas_sp.AAC.1
MQVSRKLRRRVHLSGVLADDGPPCTTVEESGNVLARYWEGVFAAKEEDMSGREEFLEHCQSVRPLREVVQWRIERYDFIRAIRAKPTTAPGPDGIPCSCWQTDPVANLLYDVHEYLYDTNSTDFPIDMRHVLLTFLPKGLQDSSAGTAVFRDASKTRPLAPADTSCKALSAAMGLPLASVA